MVSRGDPRRRTVLFSRHRRPRVLRALLGALQAFQRPPTSVSSILEPPAKRWPSPASPSSSFLLLMALLILLLRNILKIYADQSSSALPVRACEPAWSSAPCSSPSRPAVFMFLFSFELAEPLHRPLVFPRTPPSCAKTPTASSLSWPSTSPTMHALRLNRSPPSARPTRIPQAFRASCTPTASLWPAASPSSTTGTCRSSPAFRRLRRSSPASLVAVAQ